MLFLLSPAKTLDYTSPIPSVDPTLPEFSDQSAELVKLLKQRSAQEISELMSVSSAIADLNHQRFLQWSRRPSPKNARPALLAFNGDVYEGLEARTLSPTELNWAQEHIAILSGLYGVLKPLDFMQPYRLEMGTQLPNKKGSNLYKFWGSTISEYLNHRLTEQKAPTIVNLASQEYFKSVDLKTLKAPVIECVFEQEKSGQFKVISFLAKRARGLMARFAIKQRINTPAGLLKFNSEGYTFQESLSTKERLVFRKYSE